MGLKEYESKRRFGKTPEPEPRRETGEGTVPDLHARRSGVLESGLSPERHLIFVVHKHAARRLHYDLRLEMAGVLKSWAVPKGPAMDPSLKRLAVMVEDHPLDYKDFEGVIPAGNYGAGSVIIWDRGFYFHPSAKDREQSEKLLLEGLGKGNVKFVLAGEKLRGEFALVKTGKDEKTWLLMKKKDRYATRQDILKENRSVASHRSLDELFEAGSKSLKGQGKINQVRLRQAMESGDLKTAPVGPMPHGITPMLATLVSEPFDHPDWIFEVKWDGYRAIAEVRDRNVSLYSRNQISLNKRFPQIVEALREMGCDVLLDGEIVVVDDQGRPDFQRLQNYQKSGKGHLIYYVFDLLYFQGHDLTGLPLLRRKEILKKILPVDPGIRFSGHVPKEGVLFFEVVRGKGLEGIMAKHSESVYRMGERSRQWLKVKSRFTQEAVIAGFTEPKGGRRYFGSLVLGVFEGSKLVYIGHCGGGFGSGSLREISERLKPIIRKGCPFNTEPKTNTRVTWVRPELVCEVEFQGWTDEGLMRQPVFLGLREDKPAREVARERPGLGDGI